MEKERRRVKGAHIVQMPAACGRKNVEVQLSHRKMERVVCLLGFSSLQATDDPVTSTTAKGRMGENAGFKSSWIRGLNTIRTGWLSFTWLSSVGSTHSSVWARWLGPL